MIYRAAMLGAAGGAFSPDDIAGLQLWLDASDLSTITESSGAVSQWDDKSGNGRHATQGTASEQPATGIRTINSLNALDFDADRMVVSFASALTPPFTVAGVVMTDDVTAARYWFLDDGTNDDFNRVGINLTDYRIFDGSFVDSSGGVDTSAHIVTVLFNGASSYVRADGTQVASGNPGSTNLDGVIIGELPSGGNFWDGAVAEVLLYDGVLGSSDLASAESYLAGKWGITL